MNNTAERAISNPCDIFVRGAKKGFNLAIGSLMPNILMAYVLSDILTRLGVMAFLSQVCGPVMAVFGLPGEAIIILLTTWLSSSSAIGITVGMVASGSISPHDVTVMMPAYFLLNAQIQYMGRLLGTAGVPARYWPLLMLASVINASCAMLIMNWIVLA